MVKIKNAVAAAIADLYRQAELSGCTVQDDGESVQVDGSFRMLPLVLAVLSTGGAPAVDGESVREAITFVGGHRDGQTILWGGGDVIESDYIVVEPREQLADGVTLPGQVTGRGKDIYRRSMVTRNMFVHQP